MKFSKFKAYARVAIAAYLASKVIMPLNQLLFFTLLGTFATGRDNAHFYVIGNAIQVAAISGIFGVTFSVSGDRWEGTLAYLFGCREFLSSYR